MYLLSTCPGRKGALLGSATTVALPPQAAQEILHALLEQEEPAIINGFKGLLLDLAVVCKLLQDREEQAPGTLADEAQLALLDHLLLYLADNELPCCKRFLRGLVAQVASARPASLADSQLQPTQACGGSADAQREARFTAWKLQQGKLMDVAAAAAISLICAVHLGKRLLPGQQGAAESRRMAAWAGMQLSTFVVPWFVLAFGGARVRQQRLAVICLQGLMRCAVHAANIFCLLPCPKAYHPTKWGGAHMGVFGILVPAFQAVLPPPAFATRLAAPIRLHHAPCLPPSAFTTLRMHQPFGMAIAPCASSPCRHSSWDEQH